MKNASKVTLARSPERNLKFTQKVLGTKKYHDKVQVVEESFERNVHQLHTIMEKSVEYPLDDEMMTHTTIREPLKISRLQKPGLMRETSPSQNSINEMLDNVN